MRRCHARKPDNDYVDRSGGSVEKRAFADRKQRLELLGQTLERSLRDHQEGSGRCRGMDRRKFCVSGNRVL